MKIEKKKEEIENLINFCKNQNLEKVQGHSSTFNNNITVRFIKIIMESLLYFLLNIKFIIIIYNKL